MNDNHIVTAKKQNDGKIVLELTNHDIQLEDGERFKIIPSSEGVFLKRISYPDFNILERHFMNVEVNNIFWYLTTKDPDLKKNSKGIQYAIEASLRYVWVKRLTEYLRVDDQDVCAIMAMTDEELEEYRDVMKNISAFISEEMDHKSTDSHSDED